MFIKRELLQAYAERLTTSCIMSFLLRLRLIMSAKRRGLLIAETSKWPFESWRVPSTLHLMRRKRFHIFFKSLLIRANFAVPFERDYEAHISYSGFYCVHSHVHLSILFWHPVSAAEAFSGCSPQFLIRQKVCPHFWRAWLVWSTYKEAQLTLNAYLGLAAFIRPLIVSSLRSKADRCLQMPPAQLHIQLQLFQAGSCHSKNFQRMVQIGPSS